MILKAAGGIIAVLVMALVWSQFKVVGLEKALVVAAVKQEAAETTARTEKISGELMETQLAEFSAKSLILAKERDEARIQVDKMRDIFQDHDFAKLITAKPGLVENLMIKKTKKVFDEIDALTAD